MPQHLAYLSSFQPLTENDEQVVGAALASADRVTLIVGSARSSRSSHLNPLSLRERVDLLEQVYSREVSSGRIAIAHLADHLYQNASWELDLATLVKERGIDGFAVRRDEKGKRDRQLSRVAPVLAGAANSMSQRRREEILAGWYSGGPMPYLGGGAIAAMCELRGSAHFEWLKEEWQFNLEYRAAWAKTPYPVNVDFRRELTRDFHREVTRL